jgi:ABC-type multidrug transport system ATPase subunit
LKTVLQTQQLTKKFGRITAVNQLELSIKEGSVFGLLGPNGSGKTTTLGMILGVTSPSSGSFEWFGQQPTAKVRRGIGAILESPTFYPYLSGYQNLRVVSRIKEVNESRIDECFSIVGLLERKNDPFKGYSLGMKQRLAIASALLSDPGVLILDEPTNGLDPQGIADIRQLIIDIAAKGKTIILASHLLDEVQKVCSDFAVLKQGKMIYSGGVKESLAGQVSFELAAADLDQLKQHLDQMEEVAQVQRQNGFWEVRFHGQMDAAALNQQLMKQGVVLTHLLQKTKSLEKQFLELLAQD